MTPILFQPQVFSDERGFFFESYNQKRFAELTGKAVDFVQDNQSRSSRGVLRGLHYQLPPAAQGKLIRVVRGAIYDVAVDIRRSSPTFGEWTGYELSEDNLSNLWIPLGYAHGFLALSEVADVVYKATDFHSPEHERSIRWDDPDLGIEWPLDGTNPIVSPRDQEAPTLPEADLFD